MLIQELSNEGEVNVLTFVSYCLSIYTHSMTSNLAFPTYSNITHTADPIISDYFLSI